MSQNIGEGMTQGSFADGSLMSSVIVKRRWFWVTTIMSFGTFMLALPGFLILRWNIALLTGEFGYSWETLFVYLPLALLAAAGWSVMPYIGITRFIRRNRPFLILDNNGITIPDKGNRLLRWRDITGVSMTSCGRATYLELQLTPEAQSNLSLTERFATWGYSKGIILATSVHGMELAENPLPIVKPYFDRARETASK